jgi:hypothetical protein
MDWREMAGRPTMIEVPIGERWWAWRGGKKVGYGRTEDLWDGTMDNRRGWIIAFCWIVACSAEYVSSAIHFHKTDPNQTASITSLNSFDDHGLSLTLL